MKCMFLFGFGFLLLSVFSASKSKLLYKPYDPLVQLNSSNFHSTILGKSNAWIVEFYSSWCPHCQIFAPTWREFSRQIRTWKNIVKVAVVDCTEPDNVAICRQYEVDRYPTIKLFWRHVNETDFGEKLGGERDILSMENSLIDFLESHWDAEVPKDWPDLRPVSTKSLAELTNSMPANRQSMLLFVEQPDLYTGRKVILDLSVQREILMKRLLTTNQRLMKDLNLKVAEDTVPAVIRLYRNSFQLPLLKFHLNESSFDIRDKVFNSIIGTPRNKTKVEGFFYENITATSRSSTEGVYMTDLENAIFNLLNQEMAVSKTIEGERLSAMKSFLYVLKTYFPGSPPVMAYLAKLYDWVMQKSQSISGEEFADTLKELQGENQYLPKMREFLACKGSEPRFRGYPCSLWTLFHTLTVQAYSDVENKKSSKDNTGKVLFGIRDYVKNFFSCQACAAHFTRMAANVENEVNTTRDAVLWLWQAHNKVNLRLSGDDTEDPEHPKIQFPSAKACSECQSKDETSGDIVWNHDLVLKYLQRFYGSESIVKAPLPFPHEKSGSYKNSAMGSNVFSPLIQLFLCYCFTTSISFWMYFGQDGDIAFKSLQYMI
ncbi:hypothetical protein JTE90_012752 [Oedothorax gibbosus]|uniref:Sulfhydryl oxidase n=1 Tax=Oedothorax gibbosus TaxID=931172 RepID=A0AAV6VXE3_9ARAC|nr:hypothetical protein JTE90_012752 [Oedothorax gibbosus]